MKRLTDIEKIELIKKYETEKYSCVKLWKLFWISWPAVRWLLLRRNIKIKNLSETIRKYEIVENYFDNINDENKAYILWLLFADWCNQTEKNSVILWLKLGDSNILKKITKLIQKDKPILSRWNNQRYITIANKHISKRLEELWMYKSKTFTIKPPLYLREDLIRHFIRWYWDGDWWIKKEWKKWQLCVVWTEDLCLRIEKQFNKLWVNCYIRIRHPKNNNNIRMLEISWNKQVKKICKYLYENCNLYIDRKKILADYWIWYNAIK